MQIPQGHKQQCSQLGAIKEHFGNTNLCSQVIDFIISLCNGPLVTSVDDGYVQPFSNSFSRSVASGEKTPCAV